VTNHYDEEAQVEQLRTWWKENWQSLAAGLVIGLSVIFGWEAWKNHKAAEAANASHMYEDLRKALAADKFDEAAGLGDQLAKDYASSPYAAAGALQIAAKAVEKNKLDDAATRLDWVLKNNGDAGLAALVRLRQARVLWQQGKPDDALKLLDGDAGTYGALYAELRGDIKLAQGDRAAAAAAYQKALATAADADKGPDRMMLQRKLDDLTDAVQS
jgi:predicted negative regulator of RcsB-dependent stress response